MADRPRQIALDLPLRPAHGHEDFLVSPSNERAYRQLEVFPDGPERRVLLVGPPGSGKSHLASIFAERLGAGVTSATSLREASLPGLVSGGALVVEDVDQVGGHETELFHLLNMAREEGTILLLTARTTPDHWGIKLPDLLSRLRQLPILSIEEPDAALLRAVIVKHFVDRQLAIDTSVVDYLARHIDRSLEAARDVVARLDHESLAQGRRVTRALAAAIVGKNES
jgi:chromosomal replication initiation ATPase DnaA